MELHADRFTHPKHLHRADRGCGQQGGPFRQRTGVTMPMQDFHFGWQSCSDGIGAHHAQRAPADLALSPTFRISHGLHRGAGGMRNQLHTQADPDVRPVEENTLSQEFDDRR